MAKREKILLGLMSVAIVYIFYAFFLASPSNKALESGGGQSAASSDLVMQVTQGLKTETLSQSEAYVLSKAEEEWKKDPFLGRPLSSLDSESGKAAQAQELKITYSGYVLYGKKALGIINGTEYQVGEELESGGYIVLSLDPEKVVLQSKGKRGTITVPFYE